MLDIVRGLVRPIVTVALVATLVYLTVTGMHPTTTLADLAIATISFWFGQRTAGKAPAREGE